MTHRLGAALPVVLAVIALLSALLVGGIYAVRRVATTGRSAREGAALESSAEQALVAAVVAWDSASRADQLPGVVNLASAPAVDGIPVPVWITRLGPDTYLLVAETQGAQRPALRRRVGLLVRPAGDSAVPVPGAAWMQLP